MGTNRTQPFGYRMEFGKVVADPDEARWVVYIYEQYILGESFKSLSDTLCGTGIHYDVDKPWNKTWWPESCRIGGTQEKECTRRSSMISPLIG